MKYRINFKKEEAVFVIITIMTITRGVYTFNANVYITNGLAMVWILYSYFCKASKNNKKIIAPIIKLYTIPLIGMILYTIILWAFKKPSGLGSSIGYYTRLVSNFLWLFIMTFYAYRALIVFGIKTFKLYLFSFVASYSVFSFIPALIKARPLDMLRYALGGDGYVEAERWLEKTDVLFGLGVLFVFLFITQKRKINKYSLSLMVTMILFLFIGNKRIELGGIFAVLVYYYLIDSKLKNFNSKLLSLSIIQMLAAIIFIYIIYSGFLTEIALKYNVNFNFRIDTWTYWAGRTNFSFFYPGLGSSFVDKETFNIVNANNGFLYNGYIILNGMHSDLMKKYVELGFVPFLLWTWYISYYRIKKLSKCRGKFVADVCMLVSLLIFVLYYTDNSFDYFDTVTSTIIVVGCACFYTDDKLQNKKGGL
ncbi:MAG: hypothetical protein IJV15_14345 [Lachnospiraceae bacterium]|nr:hypothetical protein [Lachnospiraceae bacterium]